MCGICGYVNIDKSPIITGDILKRMCAVLSHRGPDDEGFYVKDNAALGHRRLSIIDLESGHQPMLDDTGTLSIVYNGEVYNFLELRTELINRGCRFKTRSDTEVVLKAYKEWGPDCLDKFNGMFALAIWDAGKRELFLARDRFGKKPLYYATFGKTFLFASELKSLFLHPAVEMKVNRLAVAKYLAHDYIPSPNTVIEGISKLEAGHYLVVGEEGLKKRRYWDFHFSIDGRFSKDLELAKAEFLELLRESVRKRLISDVPLGVFLSGGIDSSAVVAMMSTLMDPRDIKTFSIGFKERSYNEADAAQLVAKHFGTDHREKIIDAGMMLDALPKIIDTIDEPFADSSIIPTYMVSQFTREHVTVALGGDGGDEMFMGYPSFVAHRLAAIYDAIPSIAIPATRLAAAMLPGRSSYMSAQFMAERFLRGLKYPLSQRHQVWVGSFPPDEQRALFADRSDGKFFDPSVIYSESDAYYNTYPGISALDKIEYLYIKTYMVDDILTKVDRASMAVNLEVRAPLLDKELALFAASLPGNLKLRGLQTKFIMKEALKGILPEEILKKRKHGFAVPVGMWFRTGLKDLLVSTFDRKRVQADGLFSWPYVDRLLQDHFSGKIDNGRKIWALFVYQRWRDRWIGK